MTVPFIPARTMLEGIPYTVNDEARNALHRAQVMVLKVYLLSNAARAERCRNQTHELAGRALKYLSPPSTDKELLRVIFYHLLRVSTANHVNDTAQDLRAVERMCKLHDLPHHQLYKRMVEGCKHPEERWMGRQESRFGFEFAALAIAYDIDLVTQDDSYFFRRVTLADIVKSHDSYDDRQAKFRLPMPESNTDPE